jgi:hypothetical protein
MMADFIITWVEEDQGFPHDKIVDLINRVSENGHVDEPWRFASPKAQKKDRVWLLKQKGKQQSASRGIFGVGQYIGPRKPGTASNGKKLHLAHVRLTTLVDPRERFLIDWDLAEKILNMTIRRSGFLIDDDRAKALESLLPS